jgi:hypothetical protein
VTDRFIAERDYAARPVELFAAWTVHTWEVREGGAIAVSLDFDGEPYEVRGEFLTVEPCGSGSRLRLEHVWRPTGEDRSMLAAGWTNALEQLARALVQAGVS